MSLNLFSLSFPLFIPASSFFRCPAGCPFSTLSCLASHSLSSKVLQQPLRFHNCVYGSSLPSCCRHTTLPPRRCPGFEFAVLGCRFLGRGLDLAAWSVFSWPNLSNTLCRLSLRWLFERVPMLVPLALLVQASSVTPSTHLQKSLLIL